MRNALTFALASALITISAVKAAPALAETTTPAANIRLVHTADLDLGSKPGRSQLDFRLVRAAREVCGTASDADLAGQNAVRRCREDTLADARGKSDLLVAAASSEGPIAVTAAR